MPKSNEIMLRPDAKGRITLGAMAKGVSSYRAHQDEHGKIVLEPFTEIPLREQWLWKNPEALAAVQQGIKDVGEGRVTRMPSFAKYADDDIE